MMASTVKNGNDRLRKGIGFGGTVNKLCWLFHYSANVLSGEFYCGTKTFQLRYVVRNYAHTRWIAALPPCDSENRKNHAFPKASRQASSPFYRLLTACLCSGFKTTFLSFDFKKSNARSIASPTLFCLTYLLLLCVTPNWRWLTVYRPIKMPRPLADEVKICDSQKAGFRAGGFSLVPPPPRFAPDRFSRAFKMEPAIANSAFFRDKNTQTACNQAIVNTMHFISVG